MYMQVGGRPWVGRTELAVSLRKVLTAACCQGSARPSRLHSALICMPGREDWTYMMQRELDTCWYHDTVQTSQPPPWSSWFVNEDTSYHRPARTFILQAVRRLFQPRFKRWVETFHNEHGPLWRQYVFIFTFYNNIVKIRYETITLIAV